MISSKIKLKVHSITAVRDVENREGYQIEFVEVRPRPPMVMVAPPELPEEIGKMVMQIGKTMQQVLPGGGEGEIEMRKMTLILTAEEMEAFKLRPYPNQLYELTITDGALIFKEI
ncbi:arcadin 1 [Candidatus Bathyarchaeota archaeon]|nr:arcadin 1 [Candidatus Bathyarchaeota archaeon]